MRKILQGGWFDENERNFQSIKTKIMTTEEIHNFNVDHEDIKIVKVFALVQSSIHKENCSQEIKRS